MLYVILTLAIVFNALANILIKVGMTKGGSLDGLKITEMLLRMAGNYILWLGVTCFILALVAYSYALSKMNLSIAYPIMTSCGYAIVILVSVLFMKEVLNWVQISGLILITAGVWMVAVK
ncbi:MAG: SMR family transporter [Candidatus Brocadiia bacterium]